MGKAVVVAPFMGDGDQPFRWADFIPSFDSNPKNWASGVSA
ncbi:MAG: hypothetical protein WA622_15590 [Mycobacterium sp.]